MIDSHHRLVAELSLPDGTQLGHCPVEPDYYPVEQSLRFRAQRLLGSAPTGTRVRIEPIWADPSSRYLAGVAAELQGAGSEEIRCELPITYFSSQVRVSSKRIISEPATAGNPLQYKLMALPLDEIGPTETASGRDWSVTEVVSNPVFGERSLLLYRESAHQIGNSDEVADDDYPFFLPSSLLREFETLKVAAGGIETGGILVGHLYKDDASPEIFCVATALIPAEHTFANSTKLSFSPETWAAAQVAVNRRGQGEIWCAWIHSHPSRYWCKCDPETQKTCPLASEFFSADDVGVHRAVFSEPYQVGFVVSDRPLPDGGWNEAVTSLYGWRNGTVESRRFYLLNKDPYLPAGETNYAGTPSS